MELDKDLQARQEARCLAKQAEAAQVRLAQMSQQQIDTIVKAVADAFYGKALELGGPIIQSILKVGIVRLSWFVVSELCSRVVKA